MFCARLQFPGETGTDTAPRRADRVEHSWRGATDDQDARLPPKPPPTWTVKRFEPHELNFNALR